MERCTYGQKLDLAGRDIIGARKRYHLFDDIIGVASSMIGERIGEPLTEKRTCGSNEAMLDQSPELR
jgi:hypothetical protein